VKSLILQTVARVLLPIFVLFSLFLLLRGHDEPGGGFVGGLLAALAVVLQLVAQNAREVKALLPVEPRMLLGVGLLCAIISTLVPVLLGIPFFTALWVEIPFPWGGYLKLGLPLLFDIGVYLVVFSVTLTMVLTVAGEERAG
jgi:multicomponent Na+:H+ antiporter subunit B